MDRLSELGLPLRKDWLGQKHRNREIHCEDLSVMRLLMGTW